MHEIKKVALHVAIAIRHRLSPAADRHGNIIVRKHCLPAAARVACIGCNDIGTIDLTRPVVAFEPHNLIRPVGAIQHSHRPSKTLPAQVLLAQIAKPDPRLTNKAATREVDPRARHRNSPAVRRLNLGECHRLPQRRPTAHRADPPDRRSGRRNAIGHTPRACVPSE
jgi:hypothetical protein